jgi:hypothetical protein
MRVRLNSGGTEFFLGWTAKNLHQTKKTKEPQLPTLKFNRFSNYFFWDQLSNVL